MRLMKNLNLFNNFFYWKCHESYTINAGKICHQVFGDVDMSDILTGLEREVIK